MKNLYTSFGLILLSVCCFAQGFKISVPQPMPVSDFINTAKKGVVPILIKDKTLGKGVFLQAPDL